MWTLVLSEGKRAQPQPRPLLLNYFISAPSTANVRKVAYLSPILRKSFCAWLSFHALAFSMLSNWRITTRLGGGAPSNVAGPVRNPQRHLHAFGDGLLRWWEEIIFVAVCVFDGDFPDDVGRWRSSGVQCLHCCRTSETTEFHAKTNLARMTFPPVCQ